MPPHRRSPSGKLFRTDCHFAPSLRNAPASCFRWLPVPAAPPRRPGQQHLPDGSPPLRTGQPLRRSTPASNKPHPAEKSTPVWLAIWRTWAGFANSQLLRAAFCSIYLYRCANSPSYHIELLLRQTQICRPICTDCLRHLRISAR